MMSPFEKVEALYEELVDHYHDGDERELRAAAKLLLVALAKFGEHGSEGLSLVDEYVDLLKHDPVKFQKIVNGNRGIDKAQLPGSMLA